MGDAVLTGLVTLDCIRYHADPLFCALRFQTLFLVVDASSAFGNRRVGGGNVVLEVKCPNVLERHWFQLVLRVYRICGRSVCPSAEPYWHHFVNSFLMSRRPPCQFFTDDALLAAPWMRASSPSWRGTCHC